MQITGKYDNHKIIDNASLLTLQYFSFASKTVANFPTANVLKRIGSYTSCISTY